MRWPWQRTEHRASATDALVAAIFAAASNQGTGDYRAIAAVETAARLYAAAFASARVVTDDARVAERLTPAWLSMVARALIRRGEFLAVLEATPARGLELLTAGSWDVVGGPAEAGWFYRADLYGPSGSSSRTVPSAAALHVRYAVDPSRPWKGLSPLASACATGVLAGNLEQRLGEEMGAAVGAFVPTPKADGTDPDDADADPLAALRGVVARILTGPHDAHRQDPHLPMRYDTGRPRAVIRLRISQPRTTSLPCPAGLRARRPSPMMDL